jgi:hypothetical protein
MGVPDQLYATYTMIGPKEDISELIFNLSPTETPALSMCGVSTATQKFHQWQNDALAAPASNAALEGDDPTLATADVTVLKTTYCQISSKAFGVSGTNEVTAKHGRDSELALQAAKRARELKTDVDFSITGLNQISVAGTIAVARQTASLETWLETATSFGTNGVDGTSGTLARVDGTVRALTSAMIDSVIQDCWSNGGKPTTILAGPGRKTNISAFDGLGTATGRTDRADRTIYATADTYYSNFGILNVVPTRHGRMSEGTGGDEGATVTDRNLFLLDPEYLKIAYLRSWQQYDLAKTGDSIRRQMLVEWCLEVCNEKAHGMVADLGVAG